MEARYNGSRYRYKQSLASSTGSGDPLGTIMNSIFNYIWMGSAVFMYRLENNLPEINPFETFTHKKKGVL